MEVKNKRTRICLVNLPSKSQLNFNTLTNRELAIPTTTEHQVIDFVIHYLLFVIELSLAFIK